MSAAAVPALRTHAVPACPLCADAGALVHRGLVDTLFGVPGAWGFRRCGRADCGLLWLDPAPIDEDLALAYARYYTHGATGPAPAGPLRRAWAGVKAGYLSRRFGYRIAGGGWKRAASFVLTPFPTRRESLETLALHLPAVPGGRVLEIGCGAGDSLRALGELGWQAEGVDLDPEVARVAAQRGLTVRVGDVFAPAYAAETFDAVAMIHALEHVPRPLATLAEVRRILRPGGRLVIVTPNADSLGHRVLGGSWRGLEPPRHLQVFGPAALRRVARDAGFGAVTLRSSARMAAVIHAESRRIASGLPASAPGRLVRASDLAFQWRERLGLAQDPWAGEELILIAQGESSVGA